MSKYAIQYSRCHLAPTGSSLAFQLGYLQEAVRAAGRENDVDFKVGDYDHYGDGYWMRHAANAKALWARSKGADTRAIGFSWYESALPIFAAQTSGMSTSANLKGRRIAAIQVKDQAFDYDRMVYLKPFVTALAARGLTLADVTVVDLPVEREMVHNAAAVSRPFPLQMADLFLDKLRTGEVDAVASVFPPDVVQRHGLTRIYDGRTDPDINARVDLRLLVVSGSVARERRDLLVQLVAALLRTSCWADLNPGKVVPLIARDVGADEAFLRNRGIDFVRASHIEADAGMLDIMRRRNSFLRETGLLQSDVSIDEWVDASILADARALSQASG